MSAVGATYRRPFCLCSAETTAVASTLLLTLLSGRVVLVPAAGNGDVVVMSATRRGPGCLRGLDPRATQPPLLDDHCVLLFVGYGCSAERTIRFGQTTNRTTSLEGGVAGPGLHPVSFLATPHNTLFL